MGGELEGCGSSSGCRQRSPGLEPQRRDLGAVGHALHTVQEILVVGHGGDVGVRVQVQVVGHVAQDRVIGRDERDVVVGDIAHDSLVERLAGPAGRQVGGLYCTPASSGPSPGADRDAWQAQRAGRKRVDVMITLVVKLVLLIQVLGDGEKFTVKTDGRMQNGNIVSDYLEWD